MARVRPLSDLLKDTYASSTAYYLLKQEIQRYTPVRDAKHLAWHLSIPQHIYQSAVERSPSILPQADTLVCNYCSTPLGIPMKYPRFHEKTYKAFKSVHYLPSPPQECKCANLKTLTDHQGNLRIYLEDDKEESFSLNSGPIALLPALQESRKPADISKVFDSPLKPITTDPFSYEVRSEITLNHINLSRTTLHTQHSLLPTEKPEEYARAFNILILGATHIFFPTGHQLPYSQFRGMFNRPLKDTLLEFPEEHFTPSQLLAQPVLTPYTARLKNAIAHHIYFTLLPEVLLFNHEKLQQKFRERLGLPRTFAPSTPLEPYLKRFQVTSKRIRNGDPNKIQRPLSIYRELTILRLPFFKARATTHMYHLQDFSINWYKSANQTTKPPYRTRKNHLITLKRERIKLLNYSLPRLQATPQSILKYALNTLKHTQLPPHIQPNHTLIKLTSHLTRSPNPNL